MQTETQSIQNGSSVCLLLSDPLAGLWGCTNVKYQSDQNLVMLYIRGYKVKNDMQSKPLLMHAPLILWKGLGSVKTIFSENGHVAYQMIK